MPQAIDLLIQGILNPIASAASNVQNAIGFNAPGGGGRATQTALSQLTGNSKVVNALLPKTKSWFIVNTDENPKDALLYGPYEPENLTENVSSTYADAFSLNKQKAITQFLHGNVETITFQARFYAVFSLLEVEKKVEQLKSWTRKDEDLGRPPICYFWVGLDQHAKMESCVIQDVSVSYDKPGFLGSMKGATVQVSLRRYDPFSLDEVTNFDTRYHFAKPGDTYEMLAVREYGNPMFGIQLRQNHPQHMELSPGDIVKLPARSGSIRNAKQEPSSVALRNLHRRRSNPEKENHERLRMQRRVKKPRYVTT